MPAAMMAICEPFQFTPAREAGGRRLYVENVEELFQFTPACEVGGTPRWRPGLSCRFQFTPAREAGEHRKNAGAGYSVSIHSRA